MLKPGSSFGNPYKGIALIIESMPTTTKPIHQAPYQRGSDGPLIPKLKFRL